MADLYKIKPLVWDVGTDGALYSDCGSYKVSPGETGMWLSSAIPFVGFPDAASAKAATEEMDARFLANRLEPVPGTVVENLRQIASRANAALAQVEKADG